MIKNQIKDLSKSLHKEVIGFRRHIHSNPELSFQEKETGKYLSKVLKKYKISHTTGWAGNGVVAIIKGTKKGGKTIALRADIDALPILEANKVSYASKNKGVMHACGHDVHSASLLGTAIILNKLKNEFAGTVKCIFQPGEEMLPGGASIMINEGVLKNPKPRSILGQHVHPPLQAGTVGIRSGKYMASADEIFINVYGKGGHAALPENCIDTVYVSSQILIALQTVISRSKDPKVSALLSFGKINSVGGATNIIPDQVKIEGTLRSMDEKFRFKAHKLIKKIATQTARAYGASCELDIKVGYPCLVNDPDYTEKISASMKAFLGAKKVIALEPRMTAEDFAWYSHKVPACFYRLGTGNKKKGITAPVHTANFDVDESSLETGVGLMAFLALESLSY